MLIDSVRLKQIENKVRDAQAGRTAMDGPYDPDAERDTLDLCETVSWERARVERVAAARDDYAILGQNLAHQRRRLHEAFAEMRDAMRDYDMGVDEPPPYRHRRMMECADALLKETAP